MRSLRDTVGALPASPQMPPLGFLFFNFHQPEPCLRLEPLYLGKQSLEACLCHTHKLPGLLVFQSPPRDFPFPVRPSPTSYEILQRVLA